MNDDDETRIESGSGVSPTAEPPSKAIKISGGNSLPAGFHLAEFRIEQVIGEGGFGIVYLAHDTQLDRSVAVKEYMPSALASRGSDLSIAIRSERQRETFDAGMRSFINEARLLAQFDHPALVKVYRFWEERGTAYMVMPHYVGPTLRDWRRWQDRPPPEPWLCALIASLLDALALLHSRNCYHRDIAPDNILLLQDDAPLLLDFGAARRIIGDMTQALTVILKPGYAPVEQYADVAAMRQGPWTDLYALSAVVYYLISGEPPPAAVGRLMSEEIVPATQLGSGHYSLQFLHAIDAGLAVKPEDRPQDVATFRNLLFGLEQTQEAEEERTVMDLSRRTTTVRTAQKTAAAGNSVARPMQGSAQGSEKLTATDRRSAQEIERGAGVAPKARSLLWVGGLAASAVVLALAIAVSQIYLAPRRQARDSSQAADSPPPVSASSSTPVPGRAALARGSKQIVQEIYEGRDQRLQVEATVEQRTLVIDRDSLQFSVRAGGPGYVYALLASADDKQLWLLFPNRTERANRIGAGRAMKLPRQPSVAGGPPGSYRLLVLISRVARDFAEAASQSSERGTELRPDALDAVVATGGLRATAGKPVCPADDPGCDSAYGAALLEVEQVNAGPDSTIRTPPARGAGKTLIENRCADLLQRLSMGEDSPALREQLRTKDCGAQ